MLLTLSGIALAAAGDLTPNGCIDDNDQVGEPCAATVDGMDGAVGVGVSPDGTSVYVASLFDDAIVRLQREASGALEFKDCVDDNDDTADPPQGPDTCARSTDGLDAARDVAVSPDGTSVYAVSGQDDAIVRFNRKPSGALISKGCIDDNDDALDPPQGPDACAQSTDGLDGARSVAVSPDGTSVYVASPEDDAIVRFNRKSSGALVPRGCFDDDETGADGCLQLGDGLDGAADVAVSPDLASVYAVSSDDDAIVRFRRKSSGGLVHKGCIDDEDTGAEVCAGTSPGLDDALAVAVSADAASVYVIGKSDNAIASFERATGGALTPQGCIDGVGVAIDECSDDQAVGLDGPFDVAASPDGASVYATAQNGNAIVAFARDTLTGAIAFQSCVKDNDGLTTGCGSSDGLNAATGVAVSGDNSSVYAVSLLDDAIVRFDRELPPP